MKRPSTAPFVSAEHVEQQINDKVTENWMLLHKFFKGHSPGDSTVPTALFRGSCVVVCLFFDWTMRVYCVTIIFVN